MYRFPSADSSSRACLSLRSRERPLSSARPSRRSCSEATRPASSSSWASSWRDSQDWSSTPSSRRPRCSGRVPRPPTLRPRMGGWAAGGGMGERVWVIGEGEGGGEGECMVLFVLASFKCHVLCFLSRFLSFCCVFCFSSRFFISLSSKTLRKSYNLLILLAIYVSYLQT